MVKLDDLLTNYHYVKKFELNNSNKPIERFNQLFFYKQTQKNGDFRCHDLYHIYAKQLHRYIRMWYGVDLSKSLEEYFKRYKK